MPAPAHGACLAAASAEGDGQLLLLLLLLLPRAVRTRNPQQDRAGHGKGYRCMPPAQAAPPNRRLTAAFCTSP